MPSRAIILSVSVSASLTPASARAAGPTAAMAELGAGTGTLASEHGRSVGLSGRAGLAVEHWTGDVALGARVGASSDNEFPIGDTVAVYAFEPTISLATSPRWMVGVSVGIGLAYHTDLHLFSANDTAFERPVGVASASGGWIGPDRLMSLTLRVDGTTAWNAGLSLMVAVGIPLRGAPAGAGVP